MRRIETARTQQQRRQHFAMPTDHALVNRLRIEHITDSNGGRVQAFDDELNDDPWYSKFGVGQLGWNRDGKITWVQTMHPDYERRGVATALHNQGREQIRPENQNPDELADTGLPWAMSDPNYTPHADMKLGSLNERLLRYAMPLQDAYDLDFRDQPPDQTPVRPGPWYHSSDAYLAPGTVLDAKHPNQFNYSEHAAPRDDWVFMHHQPAATEVYGPRVYEVEPLDEGPYAYNGEDEAYYDGYASPRAKVIREVTPQRPEESKDFADAMSMMARLAAVPAHDGVFWHGSPSGDLRGGAYGLHIGTYDAAREALGARIGHPADGKPWDGTRTYGETMLRGYPQYGIPERLPGGKAAYGDGTPIPLDSKPNIFPVRIKGPMSNTPDRPHPDFKANGYMRAQITRGRARRGYYYTNEGEGVVVDPLTGNIKYSVSAVVPNGNHLELLDPKQYPFPEGKPSDFPTGVAWQDRTAAVPGEIHRGLTLDLDSPRTSPQLRQLLQTHGPESPEFIQELLRNGTGTYWSRDRGFAESVNPGNGLQVALSADWDGNDAQSLHPELTRELPDSWGDMSLLAPQENAVSEFNLKPNKELNVKSIRVRRKGDPDWREVLRQPVRARTAGLQRLHRGLVVKGPVELDRLLSQAVGPHWSVDPQISESFADPDYYGEGDDDIGVVASGLWDGSGRNPSPDALTGGPGYGHEHEVTLLPGTPVHLDSVRWRPQGQQSDQWNELLAEPRRVIALTRWDAYDSDRSPYTQDPPYPDETPEMPGPWYHSTDHEFAPGDIVDASHRPNFGYGDNDSPNWGPRDKWVFVDNDISRMKDWGRYTYEVQPMGGRNSGPFDWNGPDLDATDRIDGFVVPRAKVIRRIDPQQTEEDMWSKALKAAGLEHLAMPHWEAYDPGDYDDTPEPEVKRGPWWHANGERYDVGDIITPNKGYHPSQYNNFYDQHGYGDRQNWVWMDSPRQIREQWAKDNQWVYEVEPLDEGPWPFNGEDLSLGYVSPRARVKSIVKHRTAPEPRWQSPVNMRQRLVGPRPPDPNESFPVDKAAMVLGMCSIETLVRMAAEQQDYDVIFNFPDMQSPALFKTKAVSDHDAVRQAQDKYGSDIEIVDALMSDIVRYSSRGP